MMGNAPLSGNGSLRIRIARWMGVGVAAMPILLGATGGTGGPLGLSFALHLLLALPLFVALALGWRWPRRGGAAYVVLGAMFFVGLLPGFGVWWSLAFVAPLFIIAALLL